MCVMSSFVVFVDVFCCLYVFVFHNRGFLTYLLCLSELFVDIVSEFCRASHDPDPYFVARPAYW